MRARLVVYFVASCFTLGLGSAALRAEDPPAAPTPPAVKKTLAELEQEYKTLIEAKKYPETYKVIGQLWAADPARIPKEMPELLRKAALSKSSNSYLPALLQPAAKDCVPTLIKLLQSDDKENHYPASAGLQTIVDTARPALEDLLAVGPTRVRAEVIRILGRDQKPKAVESTAIKLKAVLADLEPELQVEAALALVQLKVDATRVPEVLKKNFRQHGERIMSDALRGKSPEAFRGVLELALNQQENRVWRIEAALQLAGLDKKLNMPLQTALIEGLQKDAKDSYRLAEKCAIALSLPTYHTELSIEALNRVCHDGNTPLELASAAAATLIQLDAEHAPAYVPYLLTYINRPRYRTDKAKYLILIAKLGKLGRGAAVTLGDLLPREGGTCDLLMAMILLKVDPDHPDVAHDFLREALAGKRNVGGIGLNQAKDLTLDCTPLLPEIVAALESDNAARQHAAYDLLEVGGQTGLAAIPAIEKKMGTWNRIDQAAFRGLIEKLKAAKP